jgi:uncharacterized coiled-coil protein SlyX
MKAAKDRATATQAVDANTVTERESLEAKLAQAETTAEELRVTVTNANEAVEKATATTAAATEIAAQTVT